MYTKFVDVDGQVVEVDLYGDEIYSRCSKCGKEIQVDIVLLNDILNDGGDFSSGISHVECDAAQPKLSLVKG